jgi:hypothetical protein
LACPAGAREGFNEIQAVPVPGKVAIDGDLKDWDLSGAIETFYDESMMPSFSVKLAFKKNADGKGYVLEGRIPWDLLNAKDGTPKAGDALALTVQPLWGSADGRQHRITFNEIVRQSGFAYQNTQSWGRAILSRTGRLPPAARPLSETKRRNPLTLKLDLPDARAKVVSAMLFEAAGKSVRTLPATVREESDRGAALELAWDGLDDRSRPLPPGDYTVKFLTHRGTGQKFVCSLHNSGNPPWKTDDGTGAWGGDWDDPLAAAFDGERVYLGWGFCEGGSTEMAVDPKLAKDGTVRKFWGAGLGGTDVLWGLTALAVNDDYVFLARDGAFREKIPETIRAGVSIVSRKDGSPANFPFGDKGGSRWLILSEYPAKRVPPERPLFELRKTNAFGPVHQDLDLIAIAVSGDIVYELKPIASWTKDGIPVYPDATAVRPLFMTRDHNIYDVMPDDETKRIYAFYQEGGDSTKRGDYAALVCYDYEGNVLWEYSLVWPCFALDSPFWKPGYLVGADVFMGSVKLDGGAKLLMTNGYYGDYHCLTTDGLWVAHFCKDNRLGSPADADTNYIENFTGHFYRNKDNGRFYLVGGDTDARLWEITGLETIRTAQAKVTIGPAESALAAGAAKMRSTGAARVSELVLRKAGSITVDGQLGDWPMDKACALDAGGGRTAKIALAYDEQNLYAAFEVADASPMRNQGGDASLLFKTGDACDVMLAADPAADPQRKGPAPGDLRLLFSVMQDKPLCVLYEAKGRAGVFPPRERLVGLGRVVPLLPLPEHHQDGLWNDSS